VMDRPARLPRSVTGTPDNCADHGIGDTRYPSFRLPARGALRPECLKPLGRPDHDTTTGFGRLRTAGGGERVPRGRSMGERTGFPRGRRVIDCGRPVSSSTPARSPGPRIDVQHRTYRSKSTMVNRPINREHRSACIRPTGNAAVRTAGAPAPSADPDGAAARTRLFHGSLRVYHSKLTFDSLYRGTISPCSGGRAGQT
jgi:hypothetical protein